MDDFSLEFLNMTERYFTEWIIGSRIIESLQDQWQMVSSR